MKLRTKIFELLGGKYKNLTELAQAMGISLSQVYRVQQGQRRINGTFILGAIKAFPEYKFDELFDITLEEGKSNGIQQEGL